MVAMGVVVAIVGTRAMAASVRKFADVVMVVRVAMVALLPFALLSRSFPESTFPMWSFLLLLAMLPLWPSWSVLLLSVVAVAARVAGVAMAATVEMVAMLVRSL